VHACGRVCVNRCIRMAYFFELLLFVVNSESDI